MGRNASELTIDECRRHMESRCWLTHGGIGPCDKRMAWQIVPGLRRDAPLAERFLAEIASEDIYCQSRGYTPGQVKMLRELATCWSDRGVGDQNWLRFMGFSMATAKRMSRDSVTTILDGHYNDLLFWMTVVAMQAFPNSKLLVSLLGRAGYGHIQVQVRPEASAA